MMSRLWGFQEAMRSMESYRGTFFTHLPPDVLALKQVISILRHYWDVLKISIVSVQFVVIASPPIQCSNTGLKMRNKNCEVFMHSQ